MPLVAVFYCSVHQHCVVSVSSCTMFGILGGEGHGPLGPLNPPLSKPVPEFFILRDFLGAKSDGGDGDNCSYKACKAAVKSSSPTNNSQLSYRPDVLRVAQPCNNVGAMKEGKRTEITYQYCASIINICICINCKRQYEQLLFVIAFSIFCNLLTDESHHHHNNYFRFLFRPNWSTSLELTPG